MAYNVCLEIRGSLHKEDPELAHQVDEKSNANDQSGDFESVRNLNLLGDEDQVLINLIPLLLVDV